MLVRLAERDGSVLIEALVALAIISLTVVASLNGFAESIHRLQRAEERLAALAEARSLVARVSSANSLSPGSIEGENPSGMKWTVLVEEEKFPGTSAGVGLFRISAAIRAKGEIKPLIILRTLTVGSMRSE